MCALSLNGVIVQHLVMFLEFFYSIIISPSYDICYLFNK